MLNSSFLIEFSCGNINHSMRATKIHEEIHLDIIPDHRYNVFQRIWIAAKYCCGVQYPPIILDATKIKQITKEFHQFLDEEKHVST